MDAVGDGIVKLGAVVAALGVIFAALRMFWRRVIDPALELLRALHEVAMRELNPNGGSSLKDLATKIVTRLDDEVVRHDRDMADVWAGLAELGYDRRQHEHPHEHHRE